MTTCNDPWAGLAAGSIDARRVDPQGRQDFFWVIAARSEPGLLLRLAPETGEIHPLPRMRNLELGYHDISGTRSLLLLLRDAEQRELFSSLCRDIVRAGEAASDNRDALHRSIRRTLRWHHLLRGGSTARLSLDEQRGLVGELQFLRRLTGLIGPRAAIEAWKGPIGAAKDFELDGCVVEVKARRGASRAAVRISSEDQLSDVEGCRLFLVVSAVDAVVSPNGLTLADHVTELDRIFAGAGPDACALWDAAILATGYDPSDDYSDRRWLSGRSMHFEVRDGFPRVTGPMPAGISSVRYSLQLDACPDFEVDAEIIDGLVKERHGSWTS